MVTTDLTQGAPDVAVLTARSALYVLLSHTVAYPQEDRFVHLRAEVRPLLASIGSDVGALTHALQDLLALLETPVVELQRAHAATFSFTVSPDCPTFETAYSPGAIFRQTQIMADVAGFYRAHGVVVGGAERERPDHIGTELEFMGLVTLKQARALSTGRPVDAEECRRTQELFLHEHLGCWGPALGRRIQRTAAHPFYRALGSLMTAWLAADMQLLGVDPIRQLDEPLPIPPPDADEACGDACPMDFASPEPALIDPATIH